MTGITLHLGDCSQLIPLQTLFVDSVQAVCVQDYTPQQIAAWTSGIEDKARWEDHLLNQYVLVAKKHNEIVGFGTLDKNEYLDMLFVHRDFQRQGIANLLYKALEHEAIQNKSIKLTVDASITALPFFEKMGFSILMKQTIVRKGIYLTNYSMVKALQ